MTSLSLYDDANRQPYGDPRSLSWRRVHVERAAGGLGTLAHGRESEAREGAAGQCARIEAGAVVLNGRLDLTVVSSDTYPGLASAGVFTDVGQGLLDDAQQLQLARRPQC